MQSKLHQHFVKASFLLALILHLLLFLSVILVYTKEPKHHSVPDYVPAYTYSGKVPAYHASNASNAPHNEKSQTSKSTSQAKVSETARNLFLNENSWYPQKSLLTASKEIIQNNETQSTMQDLKNIEPMLMIGDHSGASDPIMQILGRSLSAHFKYPKMEDAFQLTGRVVISMVLHPEGNFTNVHIIQSSNNQDFDTAALYAVNSAPRAIGADRFLKEPKSFVVGFLFGGVPR